MNVFVETDRQFKVPELISVREHPDYLERAVDYFSFKWGIDRKIYEESISDSLTTTNPLPRWYLLLEDDRIIGSFGLIDNDFMVRKDVRQHRTEQYICLRTLFC